MDTEEDAAEYAGIDNASVNDEFVSGALAMAPAFGRVLDLGTGPGDIAVGIARRAPDLTVTAVDLGEHMLSLARRRVAEAGLGARVQVLRADAKNTGFSAAAFDLVVANSVVHHIPEPALLFREVFRVARPGGGLFVKDLHRPGSRAQLEDLVQAYASDCSPYQRRLFSDSLHASLTAEEVLVICQELGERDVAVRRCSDRHWCLERRARFTASP